jgi:drug/metabolite transporter (DMT)-like permease
MLPYYAALIGAILTGACGQILLKMGAIRAPASLAQQFTGFYTIEGLALYVAAAVAYVFAIRRIPLTLAFPSNAGSYILVAVVAHFFWGESFGWQQIAGIILVGCGIFMLHQG